MQICYRGNEGPYPTPSLDRPPRSRALKSVSLSWGLIFDLLTFYILFEPSCQRSNVGPLETPMYVIYYSSFARGGWTYLCSDFDPLNCYQCNESVWMVPGTVAD